MKPLVTNRLVMMWLSMCPVDESTSAKKRKIYIAFTFIVTTITSCSLTSSILSVLFYLSIDFETSVYAVFQVAAEAAVLNLMIISLFKRHDIASIFTKLSEIYDASRDQQFHRKFYNRNVQQFEINFKFQIFFPQIKVLLQSNF